MLDGLHEVVPSLAAEDAQSLTRLGHVLPATFQEDLAPFFHGFALVAHGAGHFVWLVTPFRRGAPFFGSRIRRSRNGQTWTAWAIAANQTHRTEQNHFRRDKIPHYGSLPGEES